MGSTLIRSPPFHDRFYPDRDQQAIIVEYVLRSLGRGNNVAEDLSQRVDVFGPLPFDAAIDAQWIYGAHWVNLADTCAARK
jgi:hypothetical protein